MRLTKLRVWSLSWRLDVGLTQTYDIIYHTFYLLQLPVP